MPSERTVILWGFIGAPDSGKSHQQRIVLERLKRRRNLIVPDGRDDRMWNRIPEMKPSIRFQLDPRDYKRKRMLPQVHFDGIRTFTGARTIYNDEPGVNGETIRAVLDAATGFRDGALVLDDIRNHIPSTSLMPGYVNAFFGSRRKLMVDILFAGWSMEDVNRQILSLNPRLFIFNLPSQPTDTSFGKMADPDRLLATIDFVREQNAKLREKGQPTRFFWPFDPADPSYAPLPVKGMPAPVATSGAPTAASTPAPGNGAAK